MELRLVEYADGYEGNTLERAFWLKMPIQRAASFLIYDHESSQRQLLLDFKYHNRPNIGRHLAPYMVDSLNKTRFFDGIDLLLPIPVSSRRRIQRGYNQSEMLAKAIGRLTGIPTDTISIRRRHYRTSQTRLSVWQRHQNVKDTFILHNPDRLQGKHILIIDDVITTTSTIRSCAETLLPIPGIRISVLSLAVSKNLIRNIAKGNPEEE